MRLAYLILAHKDLEQLQRLIGRLSNKDTDIFIHLDQKAGDEAAAFIVSSLLKNVFFIKKRVDVRWGAYSMIQATLNGLAEIVEHATYDYINLLSGSDYPLKSNREIINFFTGNKGREFIHFRENPSPELPLGGSDRFEYYYDYDNTVANKDEYELEMKARNIKRLFINGIKPYHGSQWWSLTGQCIGYVLKAAAANKELINFYRYTKFPDEQFFQTIIMNSEFARNAVNNNLRYIDWSYINWPAIDWITSKPHPKTLAVQDIYKMKYSGKLFARKFEENTNKMVLDTIDKLLLNYKKPKGVIYGGQLSFYK
jgi:hypothetical protein